MAAIVPRRPKPFRHFGSPVNPGPVRKWLLLALVIIVWSCLCGFMGVQLSHLLKVCQ